MENDGNVEQDQVVQIPVLTPAAEEPVTRQYDGSVAPLRLARAWSTWRMQRPMERINGWAGFAAYIRLHRNLQNMRHGLALQLLQLSDEGHSILSFNDEFRHLYQALGEELGDVTIAMYTSRLPAGLRTVVFSLGPDATLDTAMQVVAARVEAVHQAEVSGCAMEIDALGFGAFVPKHVTKRTVFVINGKSQGRSGSTMDLNRLRESFSRQGVSADVFNARWTNRQCLRCGSSNHLAAHCPTTTGNASGRQ
ncbi:hypothetical protein COEREDRAFT_10716 [Coemansia reversa NRRL 1564]|uniref:CCHC-type domain-containing protein n=1 Tax=Coemansia reversa (strain ATCC 12441 / NRRL 1564) TaxID=763665 RepID=A0A2G5B4X1_COERN|nr:hypothetical protein COEREDRAFT_10716 [Coemansia reversa NRRL 1564]|eukprot:PIA14054.1 hypothetical protein COEREDRAFT_10716 [Coemansia reversa NRRL 1564]